MPSSKVPAHGTASQPLSPNHVATAGGLVQLRRRFLSRDMVKARAT
jgi:hypothetical protein